MVNWVFYGLGSAVCFATMILTYKKILQLNVDPLILNLFVFGLGFVAFLVWTKVTNTQVELSTVLILLLVLAAVLSVMGNFLDVMAVKNAPNPGYSGALKASQIILITLLAPLLLGSSLNWWKFAGVALVFIGVIIISVF